MCFLLSITVGFLRFLFAGAEVRSCILCIDKNNKYEGETLRV